MVYLLIKYTLIWCIYNIKYTLIWCTRIYYIKYTLIGCIYYIT